MAYIELDKKKIARLRKEAQQFQDDIVCAVGTDFMETIAEAENRMIFDILNGLESEPTADVVEVVRCKDCKLFMEYSEEYRRKVERADGDCYLRFMCSSSIDEQFNAVCCNDFCSYGKRKKVE